MDYNQALLDLNLDNLSDRRDKLCLRFAKKCTKHEKVKDMFPLNETNTHNTRDMDKYQVDFTHRARLMNSAIPQLQRALNMDAKQWNYTLQQC